MFHWKFRILRANFIMLIMLASFKSVLHPKVGAITWTNEKVSLNIWARPSVELLRRLVEEVDTKVAIQNAIMWAENKLERVISSKLRDDHGDRPTN